MPTNVKMKLAVTRSSVGFLKALSDAHTIFKRRRKCGHQRANLKIRSCTGDDKTDSVRRNQKVRRLGGKEFKKDR